MKNQNQRTQKAKDLKFFKKNKMNTSKAKKIKNPLNMKKIIIIVNRMISKILPYRTFWKQED